MQNYFQRLEQTLTQRHLSKGALAAHLGVALSTLSRWKKSAPRAETVALTAEFLGVDAKWLMTGEAYKKPSDREEQSAESLPKLKESPAPYKQGPGLENRIAAMELDVRLVKETLAALMVMVSKALEEKDRPDPIPPPPEARQRTRETIYTKALT